MDKKVLVPMLVAVMLLGTLAAASPAAAGVAEDADIAGVDVRYQNELQDFSHVFYSDGEDIELISGSTLYRLTGTILDVGATSQADAASRSYMTIKLYKGESLVHTSTLDSMTWVYSSFWGAWQGHQSDMAVSVPLDTDVRVVSTLYVSSDGGSSWTPDDVWTNYIGEGEELTYEDRILSATMHFSFGDVSVQDGSMVKVIENGTLTGCTVTGMIGNGTKPVVFQDPSTSYIHVALLDAKGETVYDDIIKEMSKTQIVESSYFVEYEQMDVVSELLRFNESYSIRIEQYTINGDWYGYTKQDTWTIYLDNEWAYQPPDDETGAAIYGAMGLIGIIGFIGSPMMMAALMRRGMESYRVIPILMMLMIASGVMAYVFFLGGE